MCPISARFGPEAQGGLVIRTFDITSAGRSERWTAKRPSTTSVRPVARSTR